MIKEFDIKPLLTTIKKLQANAPVDQVHQVILNKLVAKDIDKKVFDHIDPWGEILASISGSRRDYYHRAIMATPGQAVFGKDMLLNLELVGD